MNNLCGIFTERVISPRLTGHSAQQSKRKLPFSTSFLKQEWHDVCSNDCWLFQPLRASQDPKGGSDVVSALIRLPLRIVEPPQVSSDLGLSTPKINIMNAFYINIWPLKSSVYSEELSRIVFVSCVRLEDLKSPP